MGKNRQKSEKNRNSSGSAFGWAFQACAGIWLMIENIKELTSIKMEGRYDDIEITLPTGKIYAQAKAITNESGQKFATTKIKKALETLSDDIKDADKKGYKIEKLVYVTNIKNPLSGTESDRYYKYDMRYDDSSILEDDQKKIKEWGGEDFPVDSFQIYVLYFYGKGNNKFDAITGKVREFSNRVLGEVGYGEELFKSWFDLLFNNCTDKPQDDDDNELKKKDVVCPLIAIAVKHLIPYDEFKKVSDYENYDEICNKYKGIINNSICDIEFYQSVVGEYTSQKNYKKIKDRAAFKYDFVKKNWREYEGNFDQVDNKKIKKAVIEMALLTIIEDEDALDNIYAEIY